MRNRAKCKVCGDILESFHVHDFVTCTCGEISIDGGQHYLKCSAKDYSNFIRIDDSDKEIPVKFIEKNSESSKEDEKIEMKEDSPITTKKELTFVVEKMINDIERLPQQAMSLAINHYDYMSILLLFKKFLELEN